MIPHKSVFKFQELTPITGVKPYVIRFWETEFEEISPVTSDTGIKLYAKKDIEMILQIKKLLFEDKMSIPEAKASLRGNETNDTHLMSLNGTSVAMSMMMESLNLIREIKNKRNW